MPDINPRQWLPLFDAVYEMNSAVGYADFLDSVVIGLRRLIPADFTFIQLLDRRRKKIAYRIAPCNPYTPEEMRYYVKHAHEDPLTAHYDSTDDRQARRISDVISLQAWKKTAHHQNCFARVGVIRSLALPVRVNADTLAGLALDRCGSDFTRRHCDLLDAFAPHFLLAWKRHEAQWLSEEDMEPTMKTVGLSVREHLQTLGLTFREADVLYWITEGKQNREIATILGRTIGTVQEHVANLLRKLGQENRHSATVFALRVLQGR